MNQVSGWRAASMAVAMGLSLSAAAVPLVDSPPLPGLQGWQVDQGAGSLEQDFTAAAAGTLQAIAWWGYHGSNSKGSAFDQFVVSLNGVQQAGTLSSTVGADGVVNYVLAIPERSLAAGAGTLTLVNDSPDVEWFWQWADAQGNTMAFQLLAVPEPGSLALMGLGAAVLLFVARRRARPL